MEKKVYSQKFELNKLTLFGIEGLNIFFIIFLLLVGFKSGMTKFIVITTSLLVIIGIYFFIYNLLSAKKNKLIIYENHIEVSIIKFLFLKKYTLESNDIESIRTEHSGNWNIIIRLKNGKQIKYSGICLPLGKGTYYESRKLYNGLKKANMENLCN